MKLQVFHDVGSKHGQNVGSRDVTTLIDKGQSLPAVREQIHFSPVSTERHAQMRQELCSVPELDDYETETI